MQAIALGVRDDLGELRDLFATFNSLALSGLHVGLVVTVVGLVFP